MKTTIQTSRGPVRFHSVGQPIAGIPASQPPAQPVAAHTPGPWRVKDGHLIIGFDYGEIANLRGALSPYRDTVTDANARLIAACPELLAALEAAAASFDYTVSAMAQGHAVSISSLQNCAANARAVIAKAKGQA